MKIEIEKPTMNECKHWAAIVTDAMVDSSRFNFIRTTAKKSELGCKIVLRFEAVGR